MKKITLTIKAEAGSEFQAELMLKMLEVISNAFQTYFIHNHKKNKVEVEIK